MRGVVIALGVVAAAALPAGAQRVAAEIALVESAAPAGAIVLGEVRAEIHQASLIARTPARDLADKELRAQAAKLGADAVVDIRYENNSPLFSKKGFRAVGKAVKFSQPPVQVAAATQPPPVSDPGRTATFALAAQSSAPVMPPPLVAASVEPVAPVVTPPPALAAPPAVMQPAPVAAAIPAAPRGPTPEALIVLTEEDLVGRAYERLGEVTATARQTSLFPKKSARALMDEQLRAKAAALGADAVILVKYDAYSPLLSKKGAHATGVAVKYR